jgi:nucleoside-diphosphate-sugar epimerase
MTKILITGGAGFIGSHLVNRMQKNNVEITVLDNLERGDLNFISNNLNKIKFINCDLTKFDEVSTYFNQMDIVIHLASKVGGIGTYLSKPYDVMKTNIAIDSNVLESVIKYRVKKYFYASSAHIYPKEYQTVINPQKIKEENAYPANPELTYGWAKLIGEISVTSASAQHDWLNVAIARFIGIYGPNQDFNLATGSVIPVFSHRANKYPEIKFDVWGTGKETRSYCYISDALDCVEKMVNELDSRKIVGPYNVGKDESVSISEIANIIVDISKKNINIEYDITKNTVIWGQCCDCSLAKKELNWEAKTTLEEGLKIVYEDIKQRIK